MANPSYRDTALRYYVNDLPGASLPGARLQNILDCLRFGRPVTPLSLAFLQQQGLVALYRLATGALSYDRFRELALAEQSIRVEAAPAAKLAREAEARAREAEARAEARAREAAMWEKRKLDLAQAEAARLARESDPKYIAEMNLARTREAAMWEKRKLDLAQAEAARLARESDPKYIAEMNLARTREAAMWEKRKLALEQAEAARLARENDPQYIAKVKQQKLRTRYGIHTDVEQRCFGRLMDILKRVDAGQRLSEEDFVWLSFVGKDYFTEELRAAYHRLEADSFTSEFKKTHDPWAAVNASGHYRKCGCAGEADSLLGTISVEQQKSLKLKSALCTTRGGVMRDLGRWNEALRLGEKAHAFRPDDYRPCTLLGAVHWDMGNYHLGQEWFAKAVERGAKDDDVDQELRNIFFRADEAKRIQMREFLLREDPIRYAWVTQKAKAHKGRSQP